VPSADPANSERVISHELKDCLELVDRSGRAVIEGKHGRIPENLPPILERLKIDPACYVKFINRSEKTRFGNFIGPKEAMDSSRAHCPIQNPIRPRYVKLSLS